MKKIFSYFILFFLFFNITGNSEEIYPVKENLEEVFNVGKMISHDDKFTLYFRTREKAVLAKGKEFNYITDYPQDLYFFENKSKETKPLITYDWFPKQVKYYLINYDLPVFPEDFAYYLMKDNKTLIMVSAVKNINQNLIYNIATKKLDKYSTKGKLDFIVSSIGKDCGFTSMDDTYKCNYYKPLISKNLIN